MIDVKALKKRFKHTVFKIRFIMRNSPVVQTVTVIYKELDPYAIIGGSRYKAAVVIKRDKRTRRGRLYNPKRIYKRLHAQPQIYCVARVIKYGVRCVEENRYYGRNPY